MAHMILEYRRVRNTSLVLRAMEDKGFRVLHVQDSCSCGYRVTWLGSEEVSPTEKQ